MRKLCLLFILLIFSIKSLAQEPIIILGADNPLTDVILNIDLARLCSHPTDNIPNHYFEINNNTIDLRISIHPASAIFACDPPPPWVQSFLEVNFGKLAAGDYELNVFFVNSDESVIDGTPFQSGPYHNPIYFSVASLQVIPAMNFLSMISMSLSLLFFGIFYLKKQTDKT